MHNLRFEPPRVAKLRMEVFDESKIRFVTWHKSLSKIFVDKHGKSVVKTPEQSITYWYIIGQLFVLKSAKKAEFINYFDGEEPESAGVIKNKLRSPVISGNTVRLLLGKLLHSHLVEEINRGGEKSVHLTESARGLFASIIDEWIISYEKIGGSYKEELEHIKNS